MEQARSHFGGPAAEELPHVTFDTPSQIPLPWQEFNGSSSEWVDWNAVFPPGIDTQALEHDDSLQAPLAMPVWT
jgi:hypothetical protein